MNFPIIARAYGDPHLVTLDGYRYTFNGKGEFTLVESLDGDLVIQVRFTEPSDESVFAGQNGTVITALVVKSINSDTVQFEIANGALVTLVNGDEVESHELEELKFRNLTLSTKDSSKFIFATFPSGTSITVRDSSFLISDVAVTLPYKYYQQTRGLMGQFNGNTTDDLLPKNGHNAIPLSSSLREIHYNFGISCTLVIIMYIPTNAPMYDISKQINVMLFLPSECVISFLLILRDY